MDDSLTGTIVLVHPELPYDPAHRQGQAGRINNTDLANDDVFVGFPDGAQALYSTDALMVFKPSSVIEAILENKNNDLPAGLLDRLFKVYVLQLHGFSSAVKKAMDLASTDRSLRDYSMDSLQNQLENQLKEHQLRDLGR